MADKYWIAAVLNSLEQSLSPVPHEVNELDLKASLSEHKDRLSEHLMAFANYPNGGSLVFGVADIDDKAEGFIHTTTEHQNIFFSIIFGRRRETPTTAPPLASFRSLASRASGNSTRHLGPE